VQIHAYFARFDQGVRINETPDFASPELYDDQPRIYVPIESLMETVRREIGQIGEFLPVGEGLCGWRTVAEEDWANGWKQYYETIHLTDRLVINPSWIEYKPAAGEIVVSLDPGSAFGTGTHETTRMCLRFVEDAFDRAPAPPRTVLDVGTGTGILGIAAALLGARRVLGIDTDPVAVEVAAKNAKQNGVAAAFRAEGTPLSRVEGEFDLVLGNLIAEILVDLSDAIVARCAPGGRMILSGILTEKSGWVAEEYGRHGASVIGDATDGEWSALLLRRET